MKRNYIQKMIENKIKFGRERNLYDLFILKYGLKLAFGLYTLTFLIWIYGWFLK